MTQNPSASTNANRFSELEPHISFAQALLQRYSGQEINQMRAQLAHIQQKQKDEQLNLTVVGEFGTGKSTFINAMLRKDDFLVSSAMQGTTVAATVISHSSRFSMDTEKMNGQHQAFMYDSLEEMKAGVVRATTDPRVASQLRRVQLMLPDTPLSAGFRIIDTPGTNALERWHEEVTARTIEELSDITVLIVDANKPLAQSFCDFVKNHLANVLHQCIFVVTRVDMIRPREREGVLAYLKERISQEFELADPMVLPYSAYAVLDAAQGGEASPMAELSYQSEKQMLSYMAHTKLTAQTKRLSCLIDGLYEGLTRQLDTLSQSRLEELQLLQRTQQADLAPFVKQQITQTTHNFSEKIIPIRNQIINRMNELADQGKASILLELEKCTTVEVLKGFTANRVNALCAQEGKKIGTVPQDHTDPVNELFQEVLFGFQVEFEKAYQELDILNITLGTPSYTFPQSLHVEQVDTQSALKYVSETLEKENRAFWGGAAAGAALGTAIAPGIGTLFGAVAGFIFGGSRAPDLAETKSKTKTTLIPVLNTYFASAVNNTTQAFDRYTGDVCVNIRKEMEKYLDTYQQQVSAAVTEQNNKIRQAEQKLLSVQQDAQQLSERKGVLQALMAKLDLS